MFATEKHGREMVRKSRDNWEIDVAKNSNKNHHPPREAVQDVRLWVGWVAPRKKNDVPKSVSDIAASRAELVEQEKKKKGEKTPRKRSIHLRRRTPDDVELTGEKQKDRGKTEM